MLGNGEERIPSKLVMQNIRARNKGKVVSMPMHMVALMTCGILRPGCEISSLIWIAGQG